MIITNLEGVVLHRSLGSLKRSGIINAVLSAEGVDNIIVDFTDNRYPPEEGIEAIRFLKGIGYDIRNLIKDTTFPSFHDPVNIELIRQGFDMYKYDINDIPYVASLGEDALLEMIHRGLDMSRFSQCGHFVEVGFDYNGMPVFNKYSTFISSDKDNIDNTKLEIYIKHGYIIPDTVKKFESRSGKYPLYFAEKLNLSDESFGKLLNCYDSIDIRKDEKDRSCNYPVIFECKYNSSRDRIFKRYIETSNNKAEAISTVKEMMVEAGHDLNNLEGSKYPHTQSAIIEVINQEKEELHSILSQSSTPKPSTRRRM